MKVLGDETKVEVKINSVRPVLFIECDECKKNRTITIWFW